MSSKKSLSFKTYVQNFLCLFISISVYCLSSLSHCYWFLTHKYLVNSIYYEAFRDVVDFFLLHLSQIQVCSSLLTHIPHCTVKYIYIFFAVFPAIKFSWMKPNYVILWKLLVQHEVTVWDHITHRIHRLWSQNGHELCHSGMTLMGL